MQTPIIPVTPTYYQTDAPAGWDLKAICVFAATGFFLDRDTYYRNQKVMPPATDFTLDDHKNLTSAKPYFQWHHSPRELSFEQASDEFTELFETIMDEQIGNKKVILPLSGGLDSRSQAVALKYLGKEVHSYSYEFERGYPEAEIGIKIAQVCAFPFQKFTIPQGYLWDCIEDLGTINDCNSEFTHPRQMAVIDKLGGLGDIFSLGHWGDVLFDRGVGEGITEVDFPNYLLKKIVKKGGMELAQSLWETWGIEGDFEAYLRSRLQELWEGIPIENLDARMRAFKSMYWAPRWTSTNLSVFASVKPISLPYYDNRMCEFICGIPEEYLADRRLQIAYIKQRNSEVAKITWQSQKPYNLYNYHWNKMPYNIPYRLFAKAARELKGWTGASYVQRNWELQFLGGANDAKLRDYLFESRLKDWVPEKVIQEIYSKFKTQDQVVYSHPVSMLVALAIKQKQAE